MQLKSVKYVCEDGKQFDDFDSADLYSEKQGFKVIKKVRVFEEAVEFPVTY